MLRLSRCHALLVIVHSMLLGLSDAFHTNNLPQFDSRTVAPSPYVKQEDSVMHSTTTSLQATSKVQAGTQTPEERARRKELLNRKGPFFELDRSSGQVEFGSTAKLVTTLLAEEEEANPESIATWLSDGRGLALSIWDEDLLTELGDSVYRLQTMNLPELLSQLFDNQPVLTLLRNQPVLTLFVIIGLGYLIGNIRIGSFSFGPVAGVLFVGLFLGHFGFLMSPGAQAVGFALFIFSVGYQAGPRFFDVLMTDDDLVFAE